MLTPPQANDPNFYTYANYYNFLATEYAIDDLVEVVNGNVFADAVTQTLQGPDFNLPLKETTCAAPSMPAASTGCSSWMSRPATARAQ